MCGAKSAEKTNKLHSPFLEVAILDFLKQRFVSLHFLICKVAIFITFYCFASVFVIYRGWS